MSIPPTMEHDDEHDAWLREALRHAPDAEVGPPAALSEMILREARLKARRIAPPPRPPRSLATRIWIWFAQPVVGAGLASVMIGTLVGVMWWDRPLPEDGARVAMVPSAAPAPVEQAPTPPAPAPVPAPAPKLLERQAATDMAAPRRRAAEAKRERDEIAPAQAPAQASVAAPAPMAAQAPAPVRTDAMAKAARTADAMAPAAPAIMAATPAPPPAPAPAVAAESGRAAGTVADSAKTSPGVPAALNLNAAESRRPELRSVQRSFTALRVAVSTDAEHWSRQRGGAAPEAVDDRLAAWLAHVDAAVGARWAASAAPPASSSDVAVRLLRDGHVVHTLQLDAQGIHWQQALPDGGMQHWSATLDDAQLRALRAELERIAP